jgi:hypothetical protein
MKRTRKTARRDKARERQGARREGKTEGTACMFCRQPDIPITPAMSAQEIEKAVRANFKYELNRAIGSALYDECDVIEEQVKKEFEDDIGEGDPDARFERRIDKLFEQRKPAIEAKIRAEFEPKIQEVIKTSALRGSSPGRLGPFPGNEGGNQPDA